jgi:hypothetical protein
MLCVVLTAVTTPRHDGAAQQRNEYRRPDHGANHAEMLATGIVCQFLR